MGARESVARLAARRGLGHAYLLEGEAGQTRGALARALVCALVCTGSGEVPCMACAHCKKAAAGIHPDVIMLAPEAGKELTVKQLRALRNDAYIRPNEAARKVYWIDDAHRMNASAQNALLTVLEDGPRYAAFVLETPSTALLLTTIVSRCEVLRALPEDAAADGGEAAAELAAALRQGDELSLLACCLRLEKQKRDVLLTILDGATAMLTAEVQQTAEAQRRALRAIAALRRCRAACAFNVGAGHIAGYLPAAVFQTKEGWNTYDGNHQRPV